MTTASRCRALYVHVPFCRSLCGYCDFYSEVLRPAALRPYLAAVAGELADAARPRGWRFDTVYLGGGTPTVLPVADLRTLLAAVGDYIDGTRPLEFTVEANPATVSADTIAALRAAGVNRVSVGAQSFLPDELRVLERTHTPGDVEKTVTALRQGGFTHYSLDLIFGIPGQTVATWEQSLQQALDLGPEHMSCYGLTYEAGTPLYEHRARGRLQPLDEDLEADLYELTLDRLAAAGLPQYEISSFSRPGCECRHNLRYWHNEPYLGVGPAAAGFIDGVRYKNVSDTAAYVAAMEAGQSPWSEQETLPPEQRAGEAAMLLLRLNRGIDRAEFQARYGRDPAEQFAEPIGRHAADGLIVVDEKSIRLTRAGRLLADYVLRDIV
jgi:oxygen-independent coproporphyrinogen III oxidase